MRFIGNVLIALLGAAMFRFRKPRRRGTRKSATVQERLLTEPEQPEPQPSAPRTEELLLQNTPPLTLPKPRVQKTNHLPAAQLTVVWLSTT